MQNDIKNNYGYNMNMSQSQAIHFQNPNIHQHIMHHPSNGLPIQTHSQQVMYMSSGHPIPHMPVQVQNHIEYSSNIPSNNSSSNYKSTTRHRSTCNITIYLFISSCRNICITKFIFQHRKKEECLLRNICRFQKMLF